MTRYHTSTYFGLDTCSVVGFKQNMMLLFAGYLFDIHDKYSFNDLSLAISGPWAIGDFNLILCPIDKSTANFKSNEVLLFSDAIQTMQMQDFLFLIVCLRGLTNRTCPL